ncbi:CDP-alcohol phosphatidyltransferase family protein [uncultured Alistipes sp.]|uniref:CDP-alcohol phosphatidyltransferase family protein n=1 Tax=uncultured Alistipes sp. TaxID=538949 RepID=UPI0025D23C39|nr:CDP-alcohol phosphatidyltransferase family protein [uncultured Alistipes sp.]
MNIRLFTIPNCVTLCNLLCGSAAAVMALVHHNLPAAFALVIAAAVFDFLDGFSARLLKSYSGIGVELDSLADMVSFGFAPAAILFTLFGTSESRWEWSETARAAGAWVPFLITAFSALRLAKFNVDDSQHTEFQGLTTTANAMFCASLGWLSAEGEITLSAETIVLIAPVMSWLLVSPVRMFSFKFERFGWRGNELRYLFAVVALVLLGLLKGAAIPVIILLYIIVSTVRWIGGRKSVKP